MNEEYFSYVEKLKNLNFEKKLIYLQKKYKNKKILLYGAGLFFDVIANNYDLKSYLNIVGIGDIKFTKQKIDKYKGFSTFSPEEIKKLDIDIIMPTNLSPKTIEKALKKNNLIPKNCKIEYIIQTNLQEKILNHISRILLLVKLFSLRENILNILKYSISCNLSELETKLNYKKVLKRIKHNKSKPLKIMFILEENAKWGWQSVYDEMAKDKNFEILPIIALPSGLVDYIYTQEETINFFKKRNIKAINGYNNETGKAINLLKYKPDFILYNQPMCIKDYYSPITLSKQALCCIIPYGFSTLASNDWGSDFIKNILCHMWKMFAESPYHVKYLEKTANMKHKNIAIATGYPKLDAYKLTPPKQIENLWKDNHKSKKYRIIYAPHHSIEKYRHEMSNFKEQYQFFLDFAKNNQQYSFIFKPHPNLRYKCILENFMTAEEYDLYENEWNNLPNASVYNEGDYFGIFQTSDLLITDCSSFLGEYFISEKPIIFLDKAERAGFNELGEKIKKTFYIPQTTNDIPKLIEQLLIKKIDPTKPERIKIIKNDYYIPKESVGKYIVNYLKKTTYRI